MPNPLSIDLRERIADAYLAGEMSNAAIAERYRVSVTTVERLGRRVREGISLEPGKSPGRPRVLLDKHLAWLGREIKRDPYVSSYELRTRFHKRCPRIRVHRSTILRAMHELGFTFKKNSVRAPA